MATIRPYRAIRPNTSMLHPLEFLGEEIGAGLELDYLKYRLEPCKSGGLPRNADCSGFLDELLATGSYVRENRAAIYIHERITNGQKRTGIWALTSLEDLEKGRIARHEETLSDLEAQIFGYRSEVALEGAPIVMAYRHDEELQQLTENIKQETKGFSYLFKDTYHNFWAVDSIAEILAFKAAFSGIDQVYLADGHHRLASAKKLHQNSPQWISTVYYADSELTIEPFHRLVRRTGKEMAPELMAVLAKHFYISAIPGNRAFRPQTKGRYGMCLKGTWYQLDLRLGGFGAADAQVLQDLVLSPAFGIRDARTDSRLESYAGEEQWKKLLLEIQKDELCVVFTLCPMEVEELLVLSGAGVILPPKSTYITPKSPFGLLMYHSGLLAEKGVQA